MYILSTIWLLISSLPLYHTWISSLYVDRQKRFWVGTNKGLYLYDYENDSFILNDLEGELPRDQIMVINEDHDGNLLVGTLQKRTLYL